VSVPALGYRAGVAPPPTPSRRILGVDPGTRVAGWGLVETTGNRSRLVACGVLKMKTEAIPTRLKELCDGLRDVIRLQMPTVIAVETQFFGKNATSAFTIGMSRGVALFAAADCGVPIHEYSPATVKKAVVGNGNASKEQVAAMVRVLLGLAETPRPADVTDAIAIALAHAHRGGIAALVR
jgi:crossover junction endodeoxyribonuclease RuvC